jgi:hypothetical protein
VQTLYYYAFLAFNLFDELYLVKYYAMNEKDILVHKIIHALNLKILVLNAKIEGEI